MRKFRIWWIRYVQICWEYKKSAQIYWNPLNNVLIIINLSVKWCLLLNVIWNSVSCPGSLKYILHSAWNHTDEITRFKPIPLQHYFWSIFIIVRIFQVVFNNKASHVLPLLHIYMAETKRVLICSQTELNRNHQ